MADYANADPAIVKSGRVKKAVVNAMEKEGKIRNMMYESSFPSHNNEKNIYIVVNNNYVIIIAYYELKAFLS